MARSTIIICMLILPHLFISGSIGATFTMINECDYTVWPGILSNAGGAPDPVTGFVLRKGESKAITAPSSWGGRIWGRTHCAQNSTGKFSCVTGDCGSGKIECSGSVYTPPATLAEFSLNGSGGHDFFDVSLVDGYNLAMMVVPQGGTGDNCESTGCVADLNESCPSELQVTSSSDGKSVVACRSACDRLGDPQYCCSGAYSSPTTCKPSLYAEFLKNACPRAYSYAYDDETNTFTCASAPDYAITFCPTLNTSQNNGTTISTNQSLTAGGEATPWLSPSSDFALGFHQLDRNNLFLLAIWYYKLPRRTIVWYANGDKPAPRGSRVELTTDRGLVLDDPDGKEIWRTNFSTGVAAKGVLTDGGNLVIESTNSETLWESFDLPTDTLLPTQVLKRGGVVSSRRMETDFSRGKFRFRMLEDGNAVLNTISLETGYDYDAYFWSNTVDTDSSVAGLQVVFNQSGLLYVLRANGSTVNITTGNIPSTADYYHRATLSFDGVFTQYYHPKAFSGNPSWSVVKRVPENICLDIRAQLGTGACGFNSICRITDSKRPACECPPGHSLLDPNDAYGSCKPDFIQGCEQDNSSSAGDLYFEEVQHVDWPISDYERLEPSTIEMCRSSCLNDCICVVAVFKGSTCWKKKLPLSNGRVNSGDNSTVLIKIRKSNEKEEKKKNAKNILLVIESVLLGGSFFTNIVLLGACCLGFLVINQRKFKKPDQGESLSHVSLHCFTYKDLVEATNRFKEELGRGGFGTVYKGFIGTSSSNVVAVKRLDRVFQDGEKEFKAEVNIIGQTHHKNLVRLIGYCDEGQNRLLVYEFLSNGSLSSFLFESKPKPNWNVRTRIAFGIARGLLYLHEECTTQIIHCDIKPQNILLDDNYNARISDFGLAKLLMIDQSQTHTGIRGTKGYVAPEWFRNTPITVKVDVYSYGVILLEIICCRRSVKNDFGEEEKAILTDWGYDCYREGMLDALVEDDAEAMNEMENLKRLVMVAIWCIQEDPSRRPTMRKVSQMLEGVVEVPEPPCPSPFSIITAVN